MATSASTIIAAAVAKARRDVTEYFEKHGADAPAKAIGYTAPNSMHERQRDQLVRRGILRSTGDGRFWIDREAIRRERERNARAAKIVLIVLFALISIAVPLALLLAR